MLNLEKIVPPRTVKHFFTSFQNLEEFVQSSGEDGVIIFTMGSYATYMKEELIKEFMTAFSRLPQKVVWKVTLNFPKNIDHSKIKAMSWLPQNDLLGKKLRITMNII